MTLSVRTRFEVFKRDGFTCGYCGKTPTDGVKLEVDHITPRATGGGDEITNLVTACWACNSGKSSKDLEDKAPSLTVAAANTRERALQLDEYRKWQATLDDASGALIVRVWDEWVDAFGGEKTTEEGTTTWSCEVGVPGKEAVLKYIDEGLELVQVISAIDKTRKRRTVWHPRGPLRNADVLRYFFGVLKRMAEEGRQEDDCGGACGYDAGKNAGAYFEEKRLKDLFINHEAHGFASYSEVVAALWSDD